MRISDWSSDLCSSDLLARRSSASGEPAPDLVPARFLLHGLEESDEMNDERDQRPARNRDDPPRSEERRVGKEGVSTFRSRWLTYHSKNKDKLKQKYKTMYGYNNNSSCTDKNSK